MKTRSKIRIPMPARYVINLALVVGFYCLLTGLISSGAITNYWTGILITVGINIILAVSLNIATGYLGQLPLGHAGFMAVGAYAGGIFMKATPAAALLKEGNNAALIPYILAAIVISAIVAGIFGIIIGIPALRLRGDYLAIVTLAFGEIIRNVINCLYISLDGQRLHIAFNNPNVAGKLLVNGPAGATGVNKMATFGMGFALTLFTLFVVLNLIDSRSGRAIMAIRDNRIAAEAMGLNVTKYKMMAFVTSAVLAGMAGALYGLNFSTVAASKFKFDTSILVLVFVVLGGIGNIRGSIISATLLTILPELLRAFANYRMLIYAIVLILVMLATNNPTLRGMVERIIPRGKGRKKEADEA